MYSLYIPKYKGDPASVHILPNELANFMAATKYQYDLLVSPGYLSRTDETIRDFLGAIGKKIAAGAEEAVGLGLFHGMNGYDRVAGTGTSVLSTHRAEMGGVAGLKEIAVAPKKRDDHRKMIFFFKAGDWKDADLLDSKSKDTFLDAVKVEALLIGSSNFSLNTYFNGDVTGAALPSKGEADLLMFTDESYMVDVQKRLNSQDNRGGRQMVLFESIAGAKDPDTFFKEILKDFLAHSLS